MLKAGFARVDVTPPLGTYMAGYFKARHSRGVLDPIELNAIALSDGAATSLLITADFLCIDSTHADAIRKAIAADTGVPREHVMLTALHQHTSFGFFDEAARRRRGETPSPTDEVYEPFLYIKFRDVAKMALDDMAEATPAYAEKETAEQISFVRRYYMKDGTVATNPFGKVAEIDRPCDPPDNTVRLVRLTREGKRDIALVSFCTHPDVVSGDLYSADWPGFVRRFVEAEQGASCLLLNGAQGDSNHCDFVHGVRRGYPHAAHMGRVIADTVRDIYPTAAPMEDVRVAGGITAVTLKTRTDGIEEYEEATRFLEAYRAGTLGYTPSMAAIGHAGRVTRLPHAPAFHHVPVSVLRLGRIAIVGFGGEPFTHYAIAVREACPDDVILSACCANGYEGYLPTTLALREGGYEAASSPFPDTIEDECVAAAVALVKAL